MSAAGLRGLNTLGWGWKPGTPGPPDTPRGQRTYCVAPVIVLGRTIVGGTARPELVAERLGARMSDPPLAKAG